MVLDLAKAYDSILKLLLIEKLEEKVPQNLVRQLKVFIMTVVARVTEDITNTPIPMRPGLTQGGTSSPLLFKLFINDLPAKLREVLREKFPSNILQDPAILVSDDFIALPGTLDEMQLIAHTCAEWMKTNGLLWNPSKSQLIIMLAVMQANERRRIAIARATVRH